MIVLKRWFAFPLLIVLINTADVVAQSSFLDELRMRTRSETSGDQDVLQGSSEGTAGRHDAGDDQRSLSDDQMHSSGLEPNPLFSISEWQKKHSKIHKLAVHCWIPRIQIPN